MSALLLHRVDADRLRRPVHIDQAQHGSDLASEPMDNLSGFVDAYVAVWNESDAETRRRRIAAVWAADGTTCYRLLDAHGYEQIEERVTGSWDRWVRDGKFVFRPVNAVGHHRAVKLNFAMFATDSGNVIYDCAFGAIDDVPKLARILSNIPGIVEHGLFVKLASALVIAGAKGVKVIEA